MEQKIEQQVIQTKSNLLKEVRKQLKKEFLGIDSIIDTIMDHLSGWYLFPELRDRPLVINLWGMTGVGKSSVVIRLAELLNYTNYFYHFDLGELSGSRFNIYSQLRELDQKIKPKPFIFCFDEFQRAKSKKEDQTEIRDPNQQILWQLIDTGKLKLEFENYYDQISFKKLIDQMEHLIENGLKAIKGQVTEEQSLFKSVMYENIKKDSQIPLDLVPSKYIDIIYQNLFYRFNRLADVKEFFSQLDERETLSMLYDLHQDWINPPLIDVSNAIIFNLGNVDSLYGMSNDYSQNISADVFYRESLKITKEELREELKRLFRHEQLARMGNIHLLYPAFSREVYWQKIDQEVNKIKRKIKETQNIVLEIDQEWLDVIYEKGVIPALGFRPIISAIEEMLLSKVLIVIEKAMDQNIKADTLSIMLVENGLIGRLTKGNKKQMVTKLMEVPNTKEEDITDRLALTSTHEAGHVLCRLLLIGDLPDFVSVTSDKIASHGLVFYGKNKESITTQQSMLSELAVLFAGRASEELLFGKENISSGAHNDIFKATQMAIEGLKVYGFFGKNATYAPMDLSEYTLKNEALDVEIEHLLDRAYELAINTLRRHKTALKDMAKSFMMSKSLDQKELKEMLLALDIPDQPLRKAFPYLKQFEELPDYFINH